MANRYIEFTAVAQMSPQFGAAFGDVTVMYAVSWSYQHYGPYSIWRFLLYLTAIKFAITCAMQVMGWLIGDRYEMTGEEESLVN